MSDIISHFPSAKQVIEMEWRAPCLAHGGKDRNLSITHKLGKWLLRCWSHGCSTEDIVKSVGLKMPDAFNEGKSKTRERLEDEDEEVGNDEGQEAEGISLT